MFATKGPKNNGERVGTFASHSESSSFVSQPVCQTWPIATCRLGNLQIRQKLRSAFNATLNTAENRANTIMMPFAIIGSNRSNSFLLQRTAKMQSGQLLKASCLARFAFAGVAPASCQPPPPPPKPPCPPARAQAHAPGSKHTLGNKRNYRPTRQNTFFTGPPAV